jgi:hypothetical protein
MQEFSSSDQIAALSPDDLYAIVSDFSRLGSLMPTQVINWIADKDQCSFRIEGMADIAMQFAQRDPGKMVQIVSTKSPFSFQITIKISDSGTGTGSCSTSLSADLNGMLSMLASRPLKHLVVTINTNLAQTTHLSPQ